jgi:hypothetical protein
MWRLMVLSRPSEHVPASEGYADRERIGARILALQLATATYVKVLYFWPRGSFILSYQYFSIVPVGSISNGLVLPRGTIGKSRKG